MPYIHIPPEVLLQIFAHVRDNGDPNFHLDLLSCSMVSRFWFECAWPLAVGFFNQVQPLDVSAYSAAQLGNVIDAITLLRQLGVWKPTLLISVMGVINKQLFEQTTHGSRADIIMRLIDALQPSSKTLEIHIPDSFGANQASNIQKFVSKLYAGITSLRISGGSYYPESLKPLGRLNILIRDLRHQLQGITITGTYPPSFIQALSSCPNIRSVSIGSTSNVSDLSAAVFNWPELRSLKILGKSSDIDPIVEQLAMNTPKHLESLHFDHCTTPQLRSLIISLAPRLVHLVFPSEPSENSDEFLDLITSLDMPCLRHLDVSNLADSLTADNVVQRHWVKRQSNPTSLLRWPKLQRLNLRFCYKASPLFLELVMASCPALEGVRLGGSRQAWKKGSEDSEAILDGAGWTRSMRSIECGCGYGYGYSYTSAVTFTRPGGNVWEAEEWVEMIESRVLRKKLGRYFDHTFSIAKSLSQERVDGVVILRCVGIGCGN